MLLAGSIAVAALALSLAGAIGFVLAKALVPPARLPERAGWGMFLSLAAIAAGEAVALLLPRASARGVIVAAGIVLVAVAWRLRLPRGADPERSRPSRRAVTDAIFAIALAAGVLLYLLRAMTEPMWSNDFLAIWGLKGRTIFETRALPDWPFRSAEAGFSHPEYPIGLPLLYAGFSALLGRWDDHAMALVFPVIQLATLAVLFGWLRRRGAGRSVAIAAAGVLALFEPLYSAFLTGMAEVPLSGALLLVATSWSDALDGTDAGAVRRVTVASGLAASLKNEGIFFAIAAGVVGAVGWRRAIPLRRRAVVAAACILPPVVVYGIHRAVLGMASLRDFDPGLLRGGRLAELSGRGLTAIAAAWHVAIRPAWPGLLCLLALLVVGRSRVAGDRILAVSALAVAAYLLLPAIAVRGPDWLVRTTFVRTAAALAPAIAAGVAVRLGADSGSPLRVDPAQAQEVPERR